MLEKIRGLKRARPFVPFQIVVADGRHYTVIDPFSIAIGQTQINLYATKSDRISVIRATQIVSIDILPNQAA
jgi:hypothetical protein